MRRVYIALSVGCFLIRSLYSDFIVHLYFAISSKSSCSALIFSLLISNIGGSAIFDLSLRSMFSSGLLLCLLRVGKISPSRYSSSEYVCLFRFTTNSQSFVVRLGIFSDCTVQF